MSRLDILILFALVLTSAPLAAYLTAQAWTYGTLIARYRFRQRRKKNGD